MQPLQFFYKGVAPADAVIGTYKAAAGVTVLNYSCSIPDCYAGMLHLTLKVNSVIVTTIDLTLPGGDYLSGTVDFQNEIRLDTGDVFQVVISTGSADQAGDIEISLQFFAEIGIRAVSGQNNLQIQTPLSITKGGTFSIPETVLLYSYTFPTTVSLLGLRAFFRIASNTTCSVTLTIRKNDVDIGSVDVSEQTDFASAIAGAFLSGDILTILLTTTSSGGGSQAPTDLQLFVDYRYETPVEFTPYQSPFLFASPQVATNGSIFKYIALRPLTLSIAQFFLKAVAAVDVLFKIKVDGIQYAQLTLPAASLSSTPTQFVIPMAIGQELSIVVSWTAGPSSITNVSGILDYFLGNAELLASAVTFYSDPDSHLILLARQVGIGGKIADAITLTNLVKYKQDVDDILNARLRPLYRTPLQRVTALGNPWPVPIQQIAQRLVLQRLLHDIYTEIEPNKTAAIESNAGLAEEDLSKILRREIQLFGQKLRSRNAGSNPATAPLAETGDNTSVTGSFSPQKIS